MTAFWAWLKARAHDLLTGQDNKTHDLGRWSWATCTAAALAHDAWQLAHGVQTNVKDLAFALASIAGAHGIALGMKSTTEPTTPPSGGPDA